MLDCCVPPAPVAEGDSCAAKGGTCAPVGGCGQSNAWFVEDGGGCSGTYGPSATCCAPADSCAGRGTQLCCSYDGAGAPMTSFFPQCERGVVGCFEGTSLVCEADCQP